MNHVRMSRLAAVAVSAALFLTACGQRPGVHVEDTIDGGTVAQGEFGDTGTGGSADTGSTGTAAGGTSDTGTTTGGAATTEDPDGATAGTSGGTGSTRSTGTSGGSGSTGGGTQGSGGETGGTSGGETGGTSGGETGGTTGGGSGGNTQTRQPTGSDRTGVAEDKITVAVHAPVTGAAPIPATSFREARDLYWLWQTEEKGRDILGRSEVEVLFADDKYSPDNARSVCRQLASEAFMVVGGGGTDQIQACGQLAGVQSFPYFSAGVTEAGLADNPWYFAASMTYRQQGILLAQYIKKNFGDAHVGAIVTDTPNFDDAVDGFVQGAQQAGLNFDPNSDVLRHPKGDTSWYNTYAQDFDTKGVEVVYILTSPVDYIDFAKQADQSGYGPFQYVGVGVSMGLNTVLGTGCPAVDDGIFFSPFPGLDVARQIEPDFFSAAQQFGKTADDLALALWGLAKQQDAMFQRYAEFFGTDLTREDFRAVVEQSSFETNLFPSVAYSPQNHFGGQEVHVLQADCAKEEHVTLQSFATGF